MKSFYLLCFSLFVAFLPVENSHASHSTPLKVGVIHSPPFAIKDPDTKIWQGLGVELFQYMAAELGFGYTFVEIKDPKNWKTLKTEYDIVIGDFPYSVELLDHFQLSIPYYATGYGILTRDTKTDFNLIYQIIRNLFSLPFLYFILIVFLFIVGISTIMWLMEKNHNKNFSQKFGPGIFSGLWWTIVTCGGVGAEIYPITRRGRIFGMLCVCFSIVVLSHVVGVISSSLTVERLGSQVRNLNDLRGMYIAGVLDEGNDIEDFLDSHYLNYVPFNTLEGAIYNMKEKKVDVVIASAPILKYYLKTNSFESLVLSPLDLGANYYGFLVNMNAENMVKINAAVLKVTGGAPLRKLLFKYLGENSK